MPDYDKLGLRCGLEIHLQLNTHKLFCNCYSQIRNDAPHRTITRRIKAVAGELGDVDQAALHELLRDQEFIYEFYQDTNCLVELDEEPPHPLNREALSVALTASLLLKARPVDEIHVMRKTVIDGSNTSGFQRTMLVATDGHIVVGDRRISIPTICLEEDAARIIKREGNRTWYRLDRLGIPLIEISTGPDITSPKEAREVAEKIGRLLHATRKLMGGLGSIRQDVNVSIKNGERVEIKGVQELSDIPKLIENEISRQLNLIEIKKELTKRGFRCFAPKIMEVTNAFRNSSSKIIRGKRIFGIRVPKFSGLVGMELMPGYRFGTELADIARTIAGLGGIFHSDELPAYGINDREVKVVRKLLGIGKEDAFVLVAGDKECAHKALESIGERCNIARSGVPKEVRRADGALTRFMRPLPGSARMYPETDEPVVKITDDMLDSIELPLTPEEERKELMEMGLGAEQVNQLINMGLQDSFKKLAKKYRQKPSLIATMLVTASEIDIGQILALLDARRIAKESINEIVEEMMAFGKTAEEVAREKNLFLLSEPEIRKIVAEIVRANRGAEFGQIMGRAMAKLRGKADAETVRKLIQEMIQ